MFDSQIKLGMEKLFTLIKLGKRLKVEEKLVIGQKFGVEKTSELRLNNVNYRAGWELRKVGA